jgi:decaprenylphospho-beta-D-erythro-pentofuranosid-2-ulose 2-reductase
VQADRKRIVIVGATSLIAEHCARIWVKSQPVDLVLVGRDLEHLSAIAADLCIRAPEAHAAVLVANFNEVTKIQKVVDEIFANGRVDIALIAHGSLPDQIICQGDLLENQSALFINGISPALFAEAFAGHMEMRQTGTIAIIGSVAGDRGRRSNYVYGAAKGLVARYAQGLQHRFASSSVKILLVKPGPTDTPMTSHLKTTGAKLADPQVVAELIVKAIASGQQAVYAPTKWALIMMVIRHLPAKIFNKLNI